MLNCSYRFNTGWIHDKKRCSILFLYIKSLEAASPKIFTGFQKKRLKKSCIKILQKELEIGQFFSSILHRNNPKNKNILVLKLKNPFKMCDIINRIRLRVTISLKTTNPCQLFSKPTKSASVERGHIQITIYIKILLF